jgi:hypothetical protein
LALDAGADEDAATSGFFTERESHAEAPPKRRRALALLVFVALAFSLAWSSQVALAWTVPIPGFACFLAGVGALALFFAAPSLTSLPRAERTALVVTLGVACLGAFARFEFLRFERPNRDAPRLQEIYDLAGLFPKFGRLYTGEKTYRRFENLIEATRNIPRTARLVVMPEFSFFYALDDRVNPLGQDWWLPDDYRSRADDLGRALRSRADFVVLEGREGDVSCRRGLYDTPVERLISESGNFKLTRKAVNFCVFAAARQATDADRVKGP